jgi:hypothetical protein
VGFPKALETVNAETQARGLSTPSPEALYASVCGGSGLTFPGLAARYAAAMCALWFIAGMAWETERA